MVIPKPSAIFVIVCSKSLLAKNEVRADFFQVLWQFFNPKGSLLRAGGRGGLGGIPPAEPIARKISSNFFKYTPPVLDHRHRRWSNHGGGGGIRTHGNLSATADFKSAAFDHSATPPWSDIKITVLSRKIKAGVDLPPKVGNH